MVFRKNSLYGPVDPAAETGYDPHPPRKGFFTDTSVCIGCKACEVACKEWNLVPEDGLDLTGMSYDNTGELGASTSAGTAEEDGCVASCVDWYGNARPIFLGERLFALLGYELVEGAERRGQVSEVGRTSFAPPVAGGERE